MPGYLIARREREAKRAAARQREEEVDSRLRRLHTLHTQLQVRRSARVEAHVGLAALGVGPPVLLLGSLCVACSACGCS